MFQYLVNLETLDATNRDTSNVTDMSYMFNHCENLLELDVSNFDTSNVTNMEQMFAGLYHITGLDVSSFDTSSVTNMRGMFGYDSDLRTIYASDSFVTSQVTSSDNMFYTCLDLV